MKKTKIGFISAMVLLLVVMTGCQAVGGVDLNKVMTNNLELTSYEGRSALHVEFLINDDVVLTEAEQGMLEWLDDLSIQFDSIKVQDWMTMSMDGQLQLNGETLDIQLNMTAEEMVFWIEGAKHPIVIPNIQEDMSLTPEMMQLQKLLSGEDFTQTILEVVQKTGGFIYKHLPNPATVTVEDVTETINGKEIDLKKVHIEINGAELLGLVKTFLEGIAEDEEGLKQMLADVYDILLPTITEVMEMVVTDDYGMSYESVIEILQNKEFVVNQVTKKLHGEIVTFLEKYDDLVEKMMSELNGERVFNETNVMSIDLYVDSKHQLFKQEFELIITFDADESAIEGIRVYSINEMWNHNGDIAIDQMDTSEALVINANTDIEDVLNTFEENSVFYPWLSAMESIYNQPAQVIVLDLGSDEPIPGYTQQPYIEQGATMVPLRYVSEEFAADVEWDADAKQVTVTDPLTGNVITLVVDSDTAVVNGEEVELSVPGQIRDNHVYVPLRFISESFEAEVEWLHEFKLVFITR